MVLEAGDLFSSSVQWALKDGQITAGFHIEYVCNRYILKLIIYTNSLTGITWLVDPSPSTDQLSINLKNFTLWHCSDKLPTLSS